jgi:hypothetical protein
MDTTDAAPAAGAPDDGTAADTPTHTRWRRRLVNVLAVLAVLGMFTSVIAVWSHRTLLNTDAWVETVAPLSEDPAITDAVAVALTDQVFSLIDPEQLATEALPDKADFLAAPLTNALHGWVEGQMKELLQTEQFSNFWASANRVVHSQMVALLRGESVGPIRATDGTVTLNLMPLLSRALQWIDEKAPDLIKKDIPVITQDTPVDQARTELQTLIGRPLPANFGVITLFSSADLAAAQQAVQLFDRLVFVVLAVTAALIIAAIALSQRRRRTVATLGIGLAASMLLANALMNALQKEAIGLIGGETARNAAVATISTLIEQLRWMTDLLLWIGLAVIVVAFLAGDSRPATAIRGLALTTFDRLRGRVAPAGEAAPAVATGAFIQEHRNGLAAAGVAVAVLALVLIDVTLGRLVLVLALLAVYEIGLGLVVLDREPATDAGTA